jgi:ribonucleoside-diphosphate reductase alpha chain
LAREKSAFPAFDRDRYLAGAFVSALPGAIRDAIAQDGIRNSHLTAIAPTGTISLLAGDVSSGIEPIFAPEQRRRVLDRNSQPQSFHLTDYAVRVWRQQAGAASGVPPCVVTAADLSIAAHLDMQAALQPYVDSAISKTIHIPPDTGFARFADVYRQAYAKGLKGCTVFRPNSTTAGVVQASPA